MMIIFIGLMSAHEFHLKKIDGDLYVGEKGEDITLVELSGADTFELKETGIVNEDFIRVKSKDNYVWDLKGGGKKLIYWFNPHGRWNQQFSLHQRPEGHFKIVASNQMCVTYNTLLNYFVIDDCKEKEESQLFDMVDIGTKPQSKSNQTENTDLKSSEKAVIDQLSARIYELNHQCKINGELIANHPKEDKHEVCHSTKIMPTPPSPPPTPDTSFVPNIHPIRHRLFNNMLP